MLKHLHQKHGYATQKNETVLITKCIKCDEKVDMTELFLHYKSLHKTVPPGYSFKQCDQCPSKLSTQASLLAHISTVHGAKNERGKVENTSSHEQLHLIVPQWLTMLGIGNPYRLLPIEKKHPNVFFGDWKIVGFGWRVL